MLQNRLNKRQLTGHFRKLHTIDHLVDFASNDYLGLARSQDLTAAVLKEWENYKPFLNRLGSTGSRLLTGNSSYVQELEENIAQFHGYQAGLLFNCGYMANIGLLSSLATENDCIFFDAHVHASTHDSIRLSQGKAFPFRHNDILHLKQRLNNNPTKGLRFICIESIYSTDGSQANLKEICNLSNEYEAHLIVDEAHAVGIFGAEGRGLVAQYGLTNSVFAQITTFGKALGIHGAIILGSHTLKEYLVNFSRSFIYTTALPFYSLAAIKCSYQLFPKLEEARSSLYNLISLFQKLSSKHSETHIQAIKVKGNEAALRLARQLKREGFDVRPLMSPTVQKGHELLRICLHAFNTENEVKALIKSIQSTPISDG